MMSGRKSWGPTWLNCNRSASGDQRGWLNRERCGFSIRDREGCLCQNAGLGLWRMRPTEGSSSGGKWITGRKFQTLKTPACLQGRKFPSESASRSIHAPPTTTNLMLALTHSCEKFGRGPTQRLSKEPSLYCSNSISPFPCSCVAEDVSRAFV